MHEREKSHSKTQILTHNKMAFALQLISALFKIFLLEDNCFTMLY